MRAQKSTGKEQGSFEVIQHTTGHRPLLVTGMLTTAVVLLQCLQSQAAPFIEEIDPPVLQRGTVNRVTIRGTELGQSVGVWSSSAASLTARIVSEQVSPLSAADAGNVGTVDGAARTPDEVVLDIDVPASASIGLFGLRLATRGGLSNAHIVLIDELPVHHVSRRGDAISKPSGTQPSPAIGSLSGPEIAHHVDLPACLSADCREAQIDRYSIDVQTGQQVSFEIIGNRFGKDFDPLVTLRDANGRVLARHDNSPGLLFDSRFTHTFETAGRCIIEVQDVRYAGHDFWHYVLRVGDFPGARTTIPSTLKADTETTLTLPETGGVQVSYATATNVNSDPQLQAVAQSGDAPLFLAEIRQHPNALATWIPLTLTTLDNALEIEPNETSEQSTKVVVPGVLSGVLERPGDQDWFSFDLQKGQLLEIKAATRELASAADLELVMFDPTGREVRRSDEVTYRFRNETLPLEARFSFSAGQDGEHRLLVKELTNAGGAAFTYRVHVETPAPELELFCDYARYSVPQGSWQTLPVRVTRTRLVGPVELELVGVPAGVTLEPRVIPADVSEVICRLSAAPTTAPLLATFRVAGRWSSEDGQQTATAVAGVHPLIDRQLYNKDRQLYALRENQLQLPPSLKDRMALMITEPIPFAVDLPLSELILTKYQTAALPIETVRQGNWSSVIRFDATGGQVGEIDEERDQIYAVTADAMPGQSRTEAVFHNRINTRYERTRCDVSATGEVDGHFVTLFRSFDLDVRSAFKPTFEPDVATLQPGTTTRVKVLANRTPTWQGQVTLTLQRAEPDLQIPESIVIPADQDFVEFDVQSPADTRPRRFNLRYTSAGYVGRYEESLNEPAFTIDLKPAK